MKRIFLLSPANASGVRMQMLLRLGASFPLALAVQGQGAQLGDAFQFTSGLYFRGKWAYARAFGESLVIAPGLGLVTADTIVTASDLVAMGKVPVDEEEPRFTGPLLRDAGKLDADEVVLLGSVATGKYTAPLLEVLGERLLFPSDFIGRGDMSRGGLMLRAASSGVELTYQPVLGAVLKGKRPPKLEKRKT